MDIGILGTGNMGSGLGRLWARAGHRVTFGSREPARAIALANEAGNGACGGSYRDAASKDVVLLALAWRGVEDALREAGDLRGKVLLDCTNPLTPDFMQLLVGFDDSGAEQIARRSGARVVKAFNHIYAQVIHGSPVFQGERATVFIAGDDANAKSTAAQLVEDAGFAPVDAGGLMNARLLEPFAELRVQHAYALGNGTDNALVLVERQAQPVSA